MSRILFSLILLCTCVSIDTSSAPKRILFLGNSYTQVNDLPNTVFNIAQSLGDSIYTESNTPGGYTLQLHSTDATSIAKIQQGNWDYVVIQAQSQEPSFSPAQVQANTYPYAAILDSIVNASNTCAETIFFMTWGRKNGDASNCASYPPVCTYEGMQQRLRESYLEMAMNNNASVAPVGVAWKACRDSSPTIELYNPDESHPGINGTYLTACVFYSSIFHKSSVGSNYLISGMSNADATTLQAIASNFVLDSLENWQQYGDIPKADFSFTQSTDTFYFNNMSLRYSSLYWEFGDGNTSVAANPYHVYSDTGNYVVKLSATNACGKTDEYYFALNYTMSIGIYENEFDKIYIIYSDDALHVTNAENCILTLTDLSGKTLLQKMLNENKTILEVNHLSSGIYLCTIEKGMRVMKQQKIHIQ